jgi:RND family efflux transporter MFP subunit
MEEINMPPTDTGRTLQRAAAVVAIVLLLAFLTVHFFKAYEERKLARDARAAAEAAPWVDTVTVRSTAAAGNLTLPGETAAWYESTIYARVGGYVAKWYVDIGDHVKVGQVMALIDTPELDAELSAAKAKLQVAQAQVRVKEADAAFAASSYARWRDSPVGVVSEQEREDKKAGDASAAAELEASRAQAELNQAEVDRLLAFEQFKRVTAPYSGTVTERRIDIGNLVTAGSSAGTTLLYRMAQDDPIRVFVDVPQSAAADLMRVGVPAQIIANGSASRPIAATIARTSEAIDPKTRTFRAELDIPNPQRQLVPGLYVQVDFQLKNSGFSQVPAAALVFNASGPTVAVVGADGAVHYRAVTIGRDDGDKVELSSGVTNGDRLVLNISNQIIEGAKVRVSGDVKAAATFAPRAR